MDQNALRRYEALCHDLRNGLIGVEYFMSKVMQSWEDAMSECDNMPIATRLSMIPNMKGAHEALCRCKKAMAIFLCECKPGATNDIE